MNDTVSMTWYTSDSDVAALVIVGEDWSGSAGQSGSIEADKVFD